MNIGNSIGGIVNGVKITNPSAGQALVWDGTNWSNNAISATGAVVTDGSLLGNGLTATPLGLDAVNSGGAGTFTYLGCSVDTYGRVTNPINCATPLLSVAHDATLTGNGASGSPLSVVAPGGGSVSVATDTTLTGNGLTATPLHVVAPASGTVAVAVDATLTGNGLTATPLHVVPQGVTTDATLTGNGLAGTPLSVVGQTVTHDTTLSGAGTAASPLSVVSAPTGSTGVVTDATLSGAGTTGSVLHVVSAPTGSTGVVTNATLSGNGTTASPLAVVGGSISPATPLAQGIMYGKVDGTNAGSAILGYNSGNAGTGGYNSMLGNYVGHSLTTGYSDSLVGEGAGGNLTTGYNNAFFGGATGYGIVTGQGNAMFGVDNGATGDYSSTVVLGTNATATANNQFVLGSQYYPLSTSTTATTGTHALPANAAGFLVINFNGTTSSSNIIKVPYYAA